MKFSSILMAGACVLLYGQAAQAQNPNTPLEETKTEIADAVTEVEQETIQTEINEQQPEAVVTQTEEAEVETQNVEASSAAEQAAPEIASAEASAEEVNNDNVADQLNSMQQLEQTFTFTRTVDGEVEATEKRTVTYDRKNPVRATEAGKTKLEELKASFDNELLTRTEAFEEAKLDFIIADKNRDGAMTEDEFASLVETWRQNNAREVEAPSKEAARQRQYSAFISEIDPEAASLEYNAKARQKFSFMAGASETLTQKEYIAEYLTDFDAMDENTDTLLKSEELLKFRAANRGEAMRMQAIEVTPASVQEKLQ